MENIHCKDCGQKLTGEDKVCPSCGSRKKCIALTREEKIELYCQRR